MSVEIFNITPGFVFNEKVVHNTLITDQESGKEKRRSKWATGEAKRTFKLTYRAITQSQLDSIRDFFNARRGAQDYFYWENHNESPLTETVDSNYQGTDTSQLDHYPIVANSQTIYDDGVTLVEGVNYSINDDTGLITWIIKPANGSVITAYYQFYRKVRFKADELDIERKAFQVYDVEFEFVEIEPAV